jgi:glycosyltransferase involved in cell wall biosynthesis
MLYVSAFWPRMSGSDSPGFNRGGSQVRSAAILHALHQMGTVDVAILADEKEGGAVLSHPGLNLRVRHIFRVEAQSNAGLMQKLRWTFDPRRDYPNGCGVGLDETERLRTSIRNYDLVWFFKLRSPDYFPNGAWPSSVLDIDDVPSICERVKIQSARGVRSLPAMRRMYSWREREKLLDKRFTVLSVCSDQDRNYLRGMGITSPLHVIPNAFAKPAMEPVSSPAFPPRIGFIGLLEHFPNLEGLGWFTKRCWPKIKQAFPNARLRLVGIGSDGSLKPKGQDIDGIGWVGDPAQEISTWSAMIVPIQTGGGTRVKVAEGFARKCPIVSTSLGAYGYGARNGHNMYVADSPDLFADSCIRVLREPQVAAQMANRAWLEFLDKWTWDAIRPRVWATAENCLRMKQESSPLGEVNANSQCCTSPQD